MQVAAALVLQRILDASPESRGQLPTDELDKLRREWYAKLARNEAQRDVFTRLAAGGGATPFRDTRRPEAHRDEQRRVGMRRQVWSGGVDEEAVPICDERCVATRQ